MKENELRIGNLVYIGKEVNELELVDFADLYENDTFKHFEPIPLTEEWLLKFGFKEFEIDECWYLVKDNFMFEKSGIVGFYEYMDINAVAINEGRTKYVHQLQNLYFALTGEELTLKQ